MYFYKVIKLGFICMKMKLTKNKKYLQRKFSQKVLVPQTTADFTSRVSKSYAPFTCKFPMVMHFVPILHKRYMSKLNFYVFINDKTSLKFCASFRIFLAVFIVKFRKIHYLNYVRRGIRKDLVLFQPLLYTYFRSSCAWRVRIGEYMFVHYVHNIQDKYRTEKYLPNSLL